MKLLIISNSDTIENEANIINTLFDEGLEIFHLRKPNYSASETTELLQKINSKHYSKIVLHQHYSLTKKFKIIRIHFSESNRLNINEKELKKWKTKKFILSTSVHSINDYKLLSEHFDYTFFGPVFKSISKQGYKPQSEEIIKLPKNKNRKIKIIAVSGITSEKIQKIKHSNFDGVAVLGAIWNNTNNAIKIFNECQQNVNM